MLWGYIWGLVFFRLVVSDSYIFGLVLLRLGLESLTFGG